MAVQQHVHQHYHHVVTQGRESAKPLPWWTCALPLVLLILVAFVAAIMTGNLLVFSALVVYLLVLPAALAAGIVYGIRYLLNSVEKRIRRRAQLIGDANRQHRQVLAGDEAGIYGNYPPAC